LTAVISSSGFADRDVAVEAISNDDAYVRSEEITIVGIELKK